MTTDPLEPLEEPPLGPNHAYLTGQIMGILMSHGFDVRFNDTPQGEHTTHLTIRRPSGTWTLHLWTEPEEVREL